MIPRHSQKIADLHKFLIETFETLVSVVEHGPPDCRSRLPIRMHGPNRRTHHAD